MRTAVALALAAALAFAPSPSARAGPVPGRMHEWAREASHVVAARAASVEVSQAWLRITEVLKGNPDRREILVDPVVAHDGVGPQPPFGPGDEVVLFLGRGRGTVFPVLGQGVAWLPLHEERRYEVLQAVSRVVAYEGLPSPEDRMTAYLDAVEGSNAALRGFAAAAVSDAVRLPGAGARFEDRLVLLAGSRIREARLAALRALRFAKSEKALPVLLATVDGEDLALAEAASMALASYDSEVTVRRLVALTRRPGMEVRAILDLRGSARPEAREAAQWLLGSPSPEVRAAAAASFGEWLRADEGKDALPALTALLRDPAPRVRAAAIEALATSRSEETARCLLDALGGTAPAPDPVTEKALMRSLASVCGPLIGGKAAQRVVAERLAVVIAPLDAARPASPFCVGLLETVATTDAREALARAAEGHPDKSVRELAKAALLYLMRPRRR